MDYVKSTGEYHTIVEGAVFVEENNTGLGKVARECGYKHRKSRDNKELKMWKKILQEAK